MSKRLLVMICLFCLIVLGSYLLLRQSQHDLACARFRSDLAEAHQNGHLQMAVTLETLLKSRGC